MSCCDGSGSDMNLNGSVAIVTGASGGIGRELARTLAGRGARLVLTARRVERLDELATVLRATGTDVVTVPGDVASPATASAVVDAAMERFGNIDVLVNAAGYGSPTPLLDLTDELWEATIGSCLTGPYLMSRAVLPAMLANGSGRIVQISSIAAKGAEANRTAYCAAKWACTASRCRSKRSCATLACGSTWCVRQVWPRTGGT
jgi:3-oxoacyl-[acyl-carrier protein] reductase